MRIAVDRTGHGALGVHEHPASCGGKCGMSCGTRSLSIVRIAIHVFRRSFHCAQPVAGRPIGHLSLSILFEQFVQLPQSTCDSGFK
jgi:hypothetical protein